MFGACFRELLVHGYWHWPASHSVVVVVSLVEADAVRPLRMFSLLPFHVVDGAAYRFAARYLVIFTSA